MPECKVNWTENPFNLCKYRFDVNQITGCCCNLTLTFALSLSRSHPIPDLYPIKTQATTIHERIRTACLQMFKNSKFKFIYI